MKFTLPLALVYIAFFGCVGAAVYFTGSGLCLWALLLVPTFKYKGDDEDE